MSAFSLFSSMSFSCALFFYHSFFCFFFFLSFYFLFLLHFLPLPFPLFHSFSHLLFFTRTRCFSSVISPWLHNNWPLPLPPSKTKCCQCEWVWQMGWVPVGFARIFSPKFATKIFANNQFLFHSRSSLKPCWINFRAKFRRKKTFAIFLANACGGQP